MRVPLLHTSRSARQFVKFILVGFTNTAWDFGVYITLTRGPQPLRLDPLLANGVAFLISVTNSYLLNKRWTFRDPDPRHHVQATKFLLVNAVSLAMYELLLYLLHRMLGVQDLLAKACAVIVITGWNFTANKFWTFRERKDGTRLPLAR